MRRWITVSVFFQFERRWYVLQLSIYRSGKCFHYRYLKWPLNHRQWHHFIEHNASHDFLISYECSIVIITAALVYIQLLVKWLILLPLLAVLDAPVVHFFDAANFRNQHFSASKNANKWIDLINAKLTFQARTAFGQQRATESATIKNSSSGSGIRW